MTPLPNDCARCAEPGDCQMRHNCRRTTPTRGDARLTPFMFFPGGEDCPGYWPERTD